MRITDLEFSSKAERKFQYRPVREKRLRSWGIAARRDDSGECYTAEEATAMYAAIGESGYDEQTRLDLGCYVAARSMGRPSLSEVALVLGVSRERARQIEAGILGRLLDAYEGRPSRPRVEFLRPKRPGPGQVRAPKTPMAIRDAGVHAAVLSLAMRQSRSTGADVAKASGFHASTVCYSLRRLERAGLVRHVRAAAGRNVWVPV